MGDTWRAIRDHASSARPGKAEGRLEDGTYVIQLALPGVDPKDATTSPKARC
jgi:hypothetical protein